jgi:hypothetical protein
MHFDYSGSVDDMQKIIFGLYKSPLLYKCISLQSALGFGKSRRRTLPSKLAWSVLNLKVVSVSLNMSQKPTENWRIGNVSDP